MSNAHPLFGGIFGDAGRRGTGVGIAPTSEGSSAFVPNPVWPGMQDTQQRAFPQRKANPGSNPNWMQRYFGRAKVRFAHPSGASGQVTPHRVYITPSGALTSNPKVLRTQTKYIRRWMAAAWGPVRPAHAKGAWVQLSRGDVNVGLMHVPGMPTRPVTVLQVENDMYGRSRALVRHRKLATSPREQNPVVSTRRSYVPL